MPACLQFRAFQTRERLRWQPEKHGRTLPAALLETLAARHSEAATFKLAAASVQAGALASEVMRTMFLGKAKTLLLWCGALLLVSAGVGATAYRCVAVEPGGSVETVQAPAKPKPPTPPEDDGVVKDFNAHLDFFRLTFALYPQDQDKIDERYPVRELRLMVANVPVGEPGGKGTVFARITKEQAGKIVAVLAKDNFFRDSVADADRLPAREGSYAMTSASYQNNADKEPVKRWRSLEWDLHLVRQLDAVRGCVDGEAGKQLDSMLKSLEEERKHWEESGLRNIQSVEDLDMLAVLSMQMEKIRPFAAEIQWPTPFERADFEGPRKNLDKQLHEAIRQVNDGPIDVKLADSIKADLGKMKEMLLNSIADLRPQDYRQAKRHLDKLEELAKNLSEPGIARYALDGVLPFSAWPKDLTDEQKQVRNDGLKLARTWLAKQVVEFHATRTPNIGDVVRSTSGPTKVAQEWKGQTPSELYAKDAFHINVLLIQEGYTPFVRNPQSKCDKKTLNCYESAEQYAMLHKKGIWKDPKFAEQLKKIAETWAPDEKQAEAKPQWRFKLSTATNSKTENPYIVDRSLFDVESLQYSPAGTKLLAVIKGQRKLIVLDATTLKPLHEFTAKNGNWCPLGFTNDGEAWVLNYEAKGTKFLNHLVTVPPGNESYEFETAKPVYAAALSLDGRFLAYRVDGDSAQIVLQETKDARASFVIGEHKNVEMLAFSPDGRQLACGGKAVEKEKCEVLLWDIQREGKLAGKLELMGSCAALQFSHDGSRLFAAANVPILNPYLRIKPMQQAPMPTVQGTMQWLNTKNGKVMGSMRGPSPSENAPVAGVAAAEDGKRFAALWGNQVRIFDAENSKELTAPKIPTPVSAVAFAPNGTFLATADKDNGVCLWEEK